MAETKQRAVAVIFELIDEPYVAIIVDGQDKPQYFDKDSFDSVRFERRQDGSWRIRDFK